MIQRYEDDTVSRKWLEETHGLAPQHEGKRVQSGDLVRFNVPIPSPRGVFISADVENGLVEIQWE